MKIWEQTLEGLNILVQTQKKRVFFSVFLSRKNIIFSGQLYLFLYFKHPDLFIHV